MTTVQSYDAITESVIIKASVTDVWRHLTTEGLMKTWMADAEMDLDITTDWQVGSPILIKGKLHTTIFENKGTILNYKKERSVEYTHLSSISELPSTAENFCRLSFHLSPIEQSSKLIITITNFPTESIYKHMKFYWKTAIEMLKKQVENEI